MTVTLRDVARTAGVSPKTVSRVINGDSAVRIDTRERVLAVIQSLDYVPDYAAQRMRSSHSGVIGLLTDGLTLAPLSVDLVQGAESESDREALALLVATTGANSLQDREVWRQFRAHKVAGVIVASMYNRLVSVDDSDLPFPIVLANCFDDEDQHTSVLPDDYGGGFWQAAHLLKLGHRRIAVVGLNPALAATARRLDGMRAAFCEAGVTFDPDIVVNGFVGPVEFERLVAFEAVSALLQLPNRPTAVICGNDQIALQTYAAAYCHGLLVPGDLSVIGFDDLRMIAESLRPSLTTVAMPYREIGVRAVQELGREVHTGRKVLLPCRVVERNSCAALV